MVKSVAGATRELEAMERELSGYFERGTELRKRADKLFNKMSTAQRRATAFRKKAEACRQAVKALHEQLKRGASEAGSARIKQRIHTLSGQATSNDQCATDLLDAIRMCSGEMKALNKEISALFEGIASLTPRLREYQDGALHEIICTRCGVLIGILPGKPPENPVCGQCSKVSALFR